ncbi:DNA gyrase subunit B, chloroplastic/mitochondrial [Tetrabaena socialis]|uniref:DNA gyrase subunit B, chloroplastic/mitochondrial n=1 Tax=Tetrabaena socialis TaxID=47790 RepID=A0A2J7ZXV4_9CHLO|nr:DNA gyrase subunit B, chloroplastic/mitochondrial [Tetrabaena socialis]|eukprot:PNH05099.1 DNA gyrase subunit B, chloroplastic/mitochondrial [Tetrabaena socialis]
MWRGGFGGSRGAAPAAVSGGGCHCAPLPCRIAGLAAWPGARARRGALLSRAPGAATTAESPPAKRRSRKSDAAGASVPSPATLSQEDYGASSIQAILPLKGKILNVERVTGANEALMYKNTEISNLIVALGLQHGTAGAGPSGRGAERAEDDAASTAKALEGLRYGKVVVLTDADVDGAHIRALLLTFLFRYRPQLFYAGHVYVAVPPLYKVERGKAVWWAHSEEELKAVVAEQRLAPGGYSVQRFKGLGEMMPQQLWDTTLNPATRLLRRLTVRDVAEADGLLTALMGAHVAPRKALIDEFSSKLASVALLDV